MPPKPTSVAGYLESLPPDRRAAIEAVRAAVNSRLPAGYEEGIQYGMIGWYVPHTLFPQGYHCDPAQPLPFASLASQKNYMSLYLMCLYADEAHRRWFEQAFARSGKKLDMGKACVRFKRVEELPLEVIGEAVARVPVEKYVARYLEGLGGGPRKAPARKAAAKKAPARKAAAREAPARTAAAKKAPARKTAAKRAPARKALR